MMLGKNIRVNITNRLGSPFPGGGTYELNFGEPLDAPAKSYSPVKGVLIMGIDHPVSVFDGRVIGFARFFDNGEIILIASPKSKKFIDYNIKDSISFLTGGRRYSLECLYERSCGAIVYRIINGSPRFLLIKNKRSTHWGFPKGHMEHGETPEETATREVLEETGVHITILPDFVCKSEYTIQGRIEKSVSIFLASTEDTQTVIQEEEIEDYIWLRYNDALNTLRFNNDRSILMSAKDYLVENDHIEEQE